MVAKSLSSLGRLDHAESDKVTGGGAVLLSHSRRPTPG